MFLKGQALAAYPNVTDLPADSVEAARALGVEQRRFEQMIQVALAYGDAVGIIDALRIQGWSDEGLTMPQIRLLWVLRDDDGLPVGALAERLGVNPSTITGHVDRLVKQRLVRREEDLADRRIVRNYLTDDGNVTVGAMRHIAGAFMLNILKRLGEEQLSRLQAALTDLNTAATEARREAASG